VPLSWRAVRIALVSREVYPYVGGGIAPIVAAAARQLSEIAEVTLVTSASHREAHEKAVRAGDPMAVPDFVRMSWVDEPEGDVGGFYSYMHAYSARVDHALRAAYPDAGPDLIEFCDYLAEGFVTVQARHTSDPWLRETLVGVRLHTTSEICAVLDGHVPDDFGTRALFDAEAYVLRHADRVLWSGGDVLETYRRFYGADALAPDARIPDAFLEENAVTPTLEPARSDDWRPLHLLFLGRAERRKGVQNLIRAITRLDRDDIWLRFLGGDTQTGPLQTSLRASLEAMAADDPRINFVNHVPRQEVQHHIEYADLVVAPSLWECWPNVVREALMHNRPVLATPVGGMTEMVVPGRSGWLTRDTSVEALLERISELAAAPEQVRELIRAGEPRARFEQLTDRAAFVRRYEALIAEGPRLRPRRRRRTPLVSVVIPYFRLDEHLQATLDSLAAQTYPEIETLIVNDGSLRPEDAFLYDLRGVTVITQPNTGLSAARNTGVRQARGEFVLPLDADDVIEPTFIARCVDALERDPNLAYVTTWVEYMEPDGTRIVADSGGYMPYGNWSGLIERNNVGGTCSAVIRKRVFDLGFAYSPDLTSYEDWLFYADLARAGHHGAVIPERLFRYRVRPESMMRQDGSPRTGLIFNEIRAHLREKETQWVATPR
jgi:glycogen(starch) synthase